MLPATTNDQLSRFPPQQLDDNSLSTLRSLSSLCREFRQSTSTVQRIQAGSPGARRLGPVVQNYGSKFSTIAGPGQCQQIFTRYSRFPGVNLLQTKLNELQQTLGATFDDSSSGYAERVRVLEKLNYENGTVKGVVDTIIEQHEYWKNKLSGQGNQQPVARRLAFSDASQNRPPAPTLSPSNQPIGPPKLPSVPSPRFQLSTAAGLSTQIQRLGSGSESSTAAGLAQPLQSPPTATTTTSGTSGVHASIPRPSPLGSSPFGLGGLVPAVQTLVTSGTHPPSPVSRSRFQESSGQQLGSGSSGLVVQPPALGFKGLFQPLSCTTSTSTVTRVQHPPISGIASVLPTTYVSVTGQSTTTTTAQVQTAGGLSSFGTGHGLFGNQSQTSGGLFGNQTSGGLFAIGTQPQARGTIGQHLQTDTGIRASSTSQNQLSSQSTSVQAPPQTGGGSVSLVPFGGHKAGFDGSVHVSGSFIKQAGVLGSGLGGLGGGLSLGLGGQAGGLGSGLSGLGGGLHLGQVQQASSPLNYVGTGFATARATPAQPQSNFNFGFASSNSALQPAGVNLSTPIQSTASQSSSSGTTVSPAQPSVSAVLGTATTQRDNILYIPRQPMNRVAAGGQPNNTGQESVASKDENEEEQSNSQKQAFSLSVDQAIHVCNGITDLWESKRHTDITFLVQGTRVAAHRIILASQSQYFDRLLFGEMREAREDEIQLSDVENVESFQMLMQYAYSGSVDIQNGDIQDALDVLKLSDRFGFELLKDTLGEKFIVEINMENILHLLGYADLYQVTGLLNECCAFIDQNAEDVLCSDAILTVSDHVLKVILSRDSLCTGELLIFQTVVRWKESNKMNKEEMKGVLECVRLTEIPPRILFGDVERSCLFESDSIMKALRVQNLSDFELMRPRGRKCTGINLMDDATIDISTSGSSTSSATDGVVLLNPRQPHTSAGIHLSRFSPCETLVRVTLKQECLVNTVELEGHPTQVNGRRFTTTESDDTGVYNVQNETFSYKIYVSKDGKDWKELFDYSNYSCHSAQKLHFPPLVFRMFQFELTESRCIPQLRLKFLKCSFDEDQCHKPFKFRERGIIAPLFPLKPKAYQTEGARPEIVMVNFSQPYSVSMLSFRICGPINSVADVSISNGLGAESAYLREVKAHPFNEQLSIEFPEQTVATITVEIRNMMSSTNAPPGSVDALTVLSVSDKATASSQLVDNKSQNSAQAPAGTARSRMENLLQQLVAPVIPGDSGVKGNQQTNQLKYKISGLTCQLLLTEE